MGIFDKFKGKKPEEVKSKPVKAEKAIKPEVKTVKAVKTEKAPEVALAKTESKKEIKGKSNQAFRVLVKPLITEKAAHLASINKYVFSVNPRMNKIEVKKAIRSIYKVEPLDVNIANCIGKAVRHGRTHGTTKDWKKAIVTLRPGDKIEVYEGV